MTPFESKSGRELYPMASGCVRSRNCIIVYCSCRVLDVLLLHNNMYIKDRWEVTCNEVIHSQAKLAFREAASCFDVAEEN